MKSEPSEFSIDDLKNSPNKTEAWDGVRNYQARNMMRDELKENDLVFFYHSNCKIPGIAGVMTVVREGYPDQTAFDPKDKHYDPKSKQDKPTWYHVDVKFKYKLKRIISLSELRTYKQIKDMRILQKGNRLSITPVTKAQWDFILEDIL